jgi:hypothetical protein
MCHIDLPHVIATSAFFMPNSLKNTKIGWRPKVQTKSK